MKRFDNPSRADWKEILRRPLMEKRALEGEVRAILAAVRSEGDAALMNFIQRFEGRSPRCLTFPLDRLQAGAEEADTSLREAIDTAAGNIERFHAAQLVETRLVETMPGVRCWWRDVPLDRVGLYVPGGTAPLFSTLLMLAIPARLAGCRDIIVATPPHADGTIHPGLLYAARRFGITEILACGGAHAVAALAYGTESVRSVAKIFGPGNQWVTAAKQIVHGEGVPIDMPAGPSELAVIADLSANPAWVASDLLSQAEHGPDSQVLLITTDPSLVERVGAELERQLKLLPRVEIARSSLQSSRAVVMPDLESAMELSNSYAPEHLILAVEDASRAAGLVINAASVFVGHYSPESAGDYASGTNHVLPTNGAARALAGVGVQSFMKRITFQELSAEGLRNIASATETLAAAEGLEAHRRAVSIRREGI